MKLNDYLNALRQHGMRITGQRRAVCEFLAQTESHPTPMYVYDQVRQNHPEISRATVYNTLNALRDLGLIVEISVGGEHTHYDTDPSPHVNLICLRCDQVFDFQAADDAQSLYSEIYAQTDFQPVSMQMQIMGFCRSCRDQRRAEIVQQGSPNQPEPPIHEIGEQQ